MKKYSCLLVVFAFVLGSCATLYDHYTFTETLEAKVKTSSLVKSSIYPYTEYLSEVTALKNHLDKMVLYEKAKSKNEITLRMWEHINTENSSIHRFLKLWQEKKILSPAFVTEFGAETDNIFDLMLAYENKKDKETETALERILIPQ